MTVNDEKFFGLSVGVFVFTFYSKKNKKTFMMLKFLASNSVFFFHWSDMFSRLLNLPTTKVIKDRKLTPAHKTFFSIYLS